MKSLENFKTNQIVHCQLCGKKLKRYSKINIRATYPDNNYKGSNRPIINTYNYIS